MKWKVPEVDNRFLASCQRFEHGCHVQFVDWRVSQFNGVKFLLLSLLFWVGWGGRVVLVSFSRLEYVSVWEMCNRNWNKRFPPPLICHPGGKYWSVEEGLGFDLSFASDTAEQEEQSWLPGENVTWSTSIWYPLGCFFFTWACRHYLHRAGNLSDVS